MSCITSCTGCGRAYKESSEESTNDPNRLCLFCFTQASNHPYKCRCTLCVKWAKLVPEEEP